MVGAFFFHKTTKSFYKISERTLKIKKIFFVVFIFLVYL